MNLFSTGLLCCVIVIVDGSGRGRIAPEPRLSGKYSLSAGDLVIDKVSLGLPFRWTGTALKTFARNFLKLTKILIRKDYRCEGLVEDVASAVDLSKFDFKKGLDDGILKLLDLLIVRAKRRKGEEKFVPMMTEARTNIAVVIEGPPKFDIIRFDEWNTSVYTPLLPLLSDEGMNFFGVKWRSDLSSVIGEIKSLMRFASAIIEVHNIYGKYTIEKVGESTEKTMKNFAQNFLAFSNFVGQCKDLLVANKESGGIVTQQFNRMIGEGLLPNLNSLIVGGIGSGSVNQSLKQRLILSGMQLAKKFFGKFTKSGGPATDMIAFTRQVYGDLWFLFREGREVVGGSLPEDWADKVINLYEGEVTSSGGQVVAGNEYQSTIFNPAVDGQWDLERMAEMGSTYTPKLLGVVESSSVDTLENFAHNFWIVSYFIQHANELIDRRDLVGLGVFAQFFVPMIENGLLPHLNSLILKVGKSAAGDVRLIYNGMDLAIKKLKSYLPREGVRDRAAVVNFDTWSSEIYKSLSMLFATGDASVVDNDGKRPHKYWAQDVVNMYAAVN